jgi:hypothetical protein
MQGIWSIAVVVAWAAALISAPIAAPAMTFDAAPYAHEGQTTRAIHARGPIEKGDAERFARAAEGLPAGPRLLVVSSPGGNVRAAMALAREVRARGFSVVVEDRCASACSSILFPAGERAVLRPGALLGFHSCHQAGFEHLTRRCNHVVARFAAEHGFPYAAMRYLMDPHGPGEITWLSRIAATCFGFHRDFGDPAPARAPCLDALDQLDGPERLSASALCATRGTAATDLVCIDRELGFVDGLVRALARAAGESLPSDRREAFEARHAAWHDGLQAACAHRAGSFEAAACLSRGMQDRLLVLARMNAGDRSRADLPYR